MDELRILAPNGVCGSGFLETTFEKALALQPHFIGCDAGSTDPGPSHLGGGHAAFPREAVKRDLRLMLLGARRLQIPLLIGSAGTAGGDVHLEWFVAILNEIAAAADQEVGGYRRALDRRVVGMRGRIEPVGKEIDDAGPAEYPWRQADVVDDDEAHRAAARPRVAVRRGDVARAPQDSLRQPPRLCFPHGSPGAACGSAAAGR